MAGHNGVAPAALIAGRHAEVVALVRLQVEGIELGQWGAAQLHPEGALAAQPRLNLNTGNIFRSTLSQ